MAEPLAFYADNLVLNCARCDGRHPTSMHWPRKLASNHLAMGEALADAARASKLPESTLRYWLEHDREFREQLERAKRRQTKRAIRLVRATVATPKKQVG